MDEEVDKEQVQQEAVAKKWDQGKRKGIYTQIKTRSKVQKMESVRPTVISSTLIRNYIEEYNRENKVFDKDHIPLWDLAHLSLSYQNIMDISNLKGMENLRKLQLDNNIIYRISNLEHLVSLEWLDLSFNQIEKIEGLESLNKLTDLSLYNNHIKEVSGLEKLIELNVLSLGKNKIKSYESVITYLREIPNKLEVLTLEGNPCTTKDIEYLWYVIAYLNNLKYLDYHVIKQEDRDRAIEKHREDIVERDNQKEADKNVVETPSMDKEQRNMLEEAHISCTVDIFQKILDDDENNTRLKVLPNYQDIMIRADEDIKDRTANFRSAMLKLHHDKMETINYCTEIMKTAELDSEKKSIVEIDEFKAKYKEAGQKINFNEATDDELDSFEMNMHREVDYLEDKLTTVEMNLVGILADAVSTFSSKIDAINKEMDKLNTEYCKDITELDNKFRVELREHAFKMYEDIFKDYENNQSEKWENETQLTELVLDKEAMISYFELAKDHQEQKINEKEVEIRIAIKNDWTNTLDSLTNHQHDRNRKIIQEIIAMSKERKDEISKTINEVKERY
jgi:hypothetical protein